MTETGNITIKSALSDADIDTLKAYLKESGALLSGHFRLTSGLHSGNYLQCALLLMDPVRAEWCGRKLAERLDGLKPAWVLSPALGGMIIGHELARALGVPHIFAERKGGEMMIRRGFAVPEGKPFVAVEDVITTGGSVREAASLAEKEGGNLIGICSILNRTGKESPFGEGLPYKSLISIDFPTFSEDTCPLCKAGIPIDSPGSRNK